MPTHLTLSICQLEALFFLSNGQDIGQDILVIAGAVVPVLSVAVSVSLADRLTRFMGPLCMSMGGAKRQRYVLRTFFVFYSTWLG